MNKVTRNNGLLRLALVLTILAIGIASAQAQYLVSTKSGFVNRVEGKASLLQTDAGAESDTAATIGSQMKEGDHLSTNGGGRVELLLSPGSYLRMNDNTEVVAVRTDLDNTRFDIVKGNVIVEIGEVDKNAPIEIGTPRGVISMNKSGIYRFDVVGSDVAVSVRRGEAIVGTREQVLSKTGQKISSGRSLNFLGGNPPSTTKLSDKVFDNFDEWSYLRAESLMGANYSVLTRMRSRNALMSGWIYDPLMNGYTFIPGSWLFLNPYGFGFYRRFTDCDVCWMYPSYGMSYYNPGIIGASNPNLNRIASSRTVNANAGASTGDRSSSRQTLRADTSSRSVQPYSRPTVDYSRSSRVGFGDMNPFPSTSRAGGVSTMSSGTIAAPTTATLPADSRGASGSANTARGGSSRGN